jgi:hypothetical protein
VQLAEDRGKLGQWLNRPAGLMMMVWWREDCRTKDRAKDRAKDRVKDRAKGGGELRSLNSSVSKINRHYRFSTS